MLKLVVNYQSLCRFCVDIVNVIVRDWDRSVEAHCVELARILELNC